MEDNKLKNYAQFFEKVSSETTIFGGHLIKPEDLEEIFDRTNAIIEKAEETETEEKETKPEEAEEELTLNQKTWESLTEYVDNLRNIMVEMPTDDLILYLKTSVAEGKLKFKDIKEIKNCCGSLTELLK